MPTGGETHSRQTHSLYSLRMHDVFCGYSQVHTSAVAQDFNQHTLHLRICAELGLACVDARTFLRGISHCIEEF